MRDYPDVILEFMPEERDGRPTFYHFLIDPVGLSTAARDSLRVAESAMIAWCTDAFGPGVTPGRPNGWSHSGWGCFTFDDYRQATQFKLRWM